MTSQRLRRTDLTVMVVLTALVATWPTPTAAQSPAKTSVTASARQLNLGAGETVTLTSVIPRRATETIVLKDMAGVTVRELVRERRPAGTFADTWDGVGENGRRLRDGQYRWVATLEDGNDRVTIDQSSELDGDVESKSHPDYKPWNPFDNSPLRFSHTFQKPGQILLIFSRLAHRVVPSCEPPKYFCRQIDEFQPAGEFTYEWAGVDDTGAFRPEIRSISVISSHENLSKNAIVVYGGRPVVTRVTVTPPYFLPEAGPQEVSFLLRTYKAEHASAEITWTNQESLSVLRTLRLPDVAPGLVKATWDGRGENGIPVAHGDYTVTVWVTDPIGHRVRGEILTRVDY